MTDTPTIGPGDGGDTPTLVPPGYEILGVLGRGGMGVVYRARQAKLDRVVALKVLLHAGHLDEAARARFRAEAQALAKLQHPGIVQVFEVGEHHGTPYLALECVEGGCLAGRGPLSPSQAAGLVEQLANAAQAAHDAGVVHRDLKPANVLLVGRAAGLSCDGKITDFGLAKRLDEQGQTQTGAILGTPSYMAPEQAMGRKDVGPSADVYSLGAILYECLTGRPPFLAATTYDTVVQVIGGEPAAPRSVQPGVPRDLETIALKCLRKEPSGRYASAAALADDLRRFRAGEPIHARPVGPAARLNKWARRNPALAGLSAALILLAVGSFTAVAAALLVAQKRGTDLAHTVGELTEARDRAEDAAYRSDVALAYQLWQANQLEPARETLARCPEKRRRWEWRHLAWLCRDDETPSGDAVLVPSDRLVQQGRSR